MKCKKCSSEMLKEMLGSFNVMYICLTCNPKIAEFYKKQGSQVTNVKEKTK